MQILVETRLLSYRRTISACTLADTDVDVPRQRQRERRERVLNLLLMNRTVRQTPLERFQQHRGENELLVYGERLRGALPLSQAEGHVRALERAFHGGLSKEAFGVELERLRPVFVVVVNGVDV